MPRQLRIADALRAEGCTVNEVPGWEQRGSQAFDPVGLIVHHTAGPARGDAPSLKVCIEGRSDLPGPLCHVLLARSGVCHIIAAGRAQHAGTGSWKGATGNSRFFGIEAENTGVGEPWRPVQLDAFIRSSAALLRLTGNGPEWIAGHREYAPRRKIDPAGVDLDDFRRQVAARLSSHQEDDLTPEQAQMLKDVHAVLTDMKDPKAILPVVTAARDNTNRLRRMVRLVAGKVGVNPVDLETAEK